MIHSVTVTNNLGESLEMILTQPELSGLIVKSIDGMGPADSNINITELVTMDGGLVNSTRLNTKEIKLDLIFMEKPTIEDTRLLTYQYFPIKKPIILTFKTIRLGNIVKTAKIYGVVEKNEPKIFQKQESATITIKCADPYFHSETLNNKMFYGAEPMFEFEYSNEIDENPPWEYYDIDVYGEDGIIDSDRIVYQDEEDGRGITIGPGEEGAVLDDFDGIDKIDIRMTATYRGGYTPYETIVTEIYHGAATRILDDPDPSVTIIPSDGHNILLFSGGDTYKGVKLYASRDSNGNIDIRYTNNEAPYTSYRIDFVLYTAHGKSSWKIIYYDPINTIQDHNIPNGTERTYVCQYPEVDIDFRLGSLSQMRYKGSITMISEDTGTRVIPDGTMNLELYYNPGIGRILVSRDGDIFTIKVITGAAYPGQAYRVDITECQVYKRYKDIFNTELGILNTITEGNIWYDGDGDTGFIIDVIFKGEATNIQFIDKETGERMAINDEKLRAKVGSVQSNDILRINTLRGQKSAKYIRENAKQEWDVLDCLVPPIQWLKLTKGKNVFGYAADTGLDKLVFDVSYDVLYGGI